MFPPPPLESLPPLPLYSLVVADGEDTTGSFHNDDHAANEAKGFVLLVACGGGGGGTRHVRIKPTSKLFKKRSMIGFFLARDDSWMMMMWLCWCYSTSCCCCWPRQVWKVLRTSLPLQAKTICSSLSPISPHLDPNVYLTEQLHHTACLIYFLLHALVLCTCWVYSTQVMPSFDLLENVRHKAIL